MLKLHQYNFCLATRWQNKSTKSWQADIFLSFIVAKQFPINTSRREPILSSHLGREIYHYKTDKVCLFLSEQSCCDTDANFYRRPFSVLSEPDMSLRRKTSRERLLQRGTLNQPSKRSSVKPPHRPLSPKRSHYPESCWEEESRQRSRERPGLMESYTSRVHRLSAQILMDCDVNTGLTKCLDHLLFTWNGQRRWIQIISTVKSKWRSRDTVTLQDGFCKLVCSHAAFYVCVCVCVTARALKISQKALKVQLLF